MGADLLNVRDAELLRLAASSEDAFAVFYRRYERLVVGWLVRRTGRADLAADLTAEVFASAYVSASKCCASEVPSWLKES
jgi:RNA polymerase sigma-70 factor (ECF subfamily)